MRGAVEASRAGRAFGYILITLGFLQIVSGMSLDGLWLALIGLFLVNAATAEEQQAQLSGTVHGVTVGRVMSSHPITADPNEPLDQFIAREVWTRPDGRVIGIVSPRDISRTIELGDLRPFDPYQGPRGADMATLAGVGSTSSPMTERVTRVSRPAKWHQWTYPDAVRSFAHARCWEQCRTLEPRDST
jgi:hypothetical protein